MPQENLPDSSEIRYFFVGPEEQGGGRQIFLNKDNLPWETLKEFEKFQGKDFMPFRFAFDSALNKLYIQDSSWQQYIDQGGEAWGILNDVLDYVRTNLAKEDRKLEWGYGDPPDTGRLRKFSDYAQAWSYVTEYIAAEFEAEPVDIAVVEYVLEEGQPLERPVFSPKGGTKAGMTVNEPAIFISKPPGTRADYIELNNALIRTYFANFEDITKTSPDVEKKIRLVSQIGRHFDPGGYDLYYAIWGTNKDAPERPPHTRILEVGSGQRNRIVNVDAVMAQKGMEDYRGPLVLFSYLPARHQLIFQNWHPDDMRQWEIYNRMLSDIVRDMGRIKEAEGKDEMTLAYDDTMLSPFVTKVSKIVPLWDAIKKLCKKNNVEPRDIDVLEAPLSEDMSTKAMFIPDTKTEAEEVPTAQKAKISHGINLTPPYMAVESRISSIGEKYHAMFHEYVHFFQISVQKLPLIPYSFRGSPGDAASQEERTARFIEYIRNEREHDAHMNQMLYMLENQWSPAEVLDWFASKKSPIARVEYRRILNEAVKEYQKELAERRGMAAKTPSAPDARKKTASLWMGVNDWWYMGLQENINEKQHYNDLKEGPPGLRPYNRKEQKKLQPKGTTESLLAKYHDEEMSSQKTTEQLLEEGRV